jgi:hypothetical protein
MHPPLFFPAQWLPHNEARALAPHTRFDLGGIPFLASRENSRSLLRLERRGGAA